MDGELISVVFVDVERSTEVLVTRGDTAGLAAVELTLAAARERIEPYGGREVKSLGDGLMLVFPAPRQAVAFAVAVQAALGARTPRLRIGINTGEVIAGAIDPTGEAVHAAARVASRAAGGEVLVSDVVRQLVGTMPGTRFTDRGRHRLKGFPERFRLHAVTAAEAEPDPVAVFGRDEELDAVRWLLDGPTGATARVLALEGEAGIGKSHLALAAAGRARSAGIRVITAGADELEQDRPGLILGALGDALGVGPSIRQGDVSGLALVDAVGDAVENAAARSALLIVVEDVHWADELSLRGLAAIGRRVASLPVGIVLTLRPAPRPPLLEPVLATLTALPARRLRLQGLDDAAVMAIVAALVGAPPGPALSERLSGTSGNPLYVNEVVRALDDEGHLTVRSGVADVATGGKPLPVTLRQTVVGRLSSLPAASVEALRLASLLGRDFTLADLATISGSRVVDVASRLQPPVEAALLTGEADTLSFRHDLIREAVYEDIVPAIRRDLHAAAGRALAAAGAPVSQVARQFALGARVGDEEAAGWLERAGRSLHRLDVAAAADLLLQALHIGGPEWDGRTRVEIALLEPLAGAGRVAEARERARDLLDRRLDPLTELDVRRGLSTVSAHTGDLARAATENLEAAAVPGIDPVIASTLTCLAAGMALLGGRGADEVKAIAEAALATATSGIPGPEADELACIAHLDLALAAAIDGHYHDAAMHATASRQLLVAGSLPVRGFLISDLWEATFQHYTDRDRDAVASLTAAQDRCVQRGETSLLVQTHSALGLTHFIAGRWDDAASEFETALAVADETGNHSHVVGGHAVLAAMALARGEIAAAEHHLATGEELLATSGHLFGVEVLLWARATALEAAGDAAGALAVLEATWDRIGTIRGLLQYRTIAPALARLAVLGGRPDLASAVAHDVERLAKAADTASATATALHCRGLADGDADVLVRAVEAARRSPHVIALAGTCEDAARALFAVGRAAEAVALADEAAAIHLSCGADADLARLDGLLRTNGVRRRRRGPAPATHGWDALSATERSVVDLVAHGLSNPQIAARLYISRRTVETHLAHVFRKLDVTSRSQLAAQTTARAASRS